MGTDALRELANLSPDLQTVFDRECANWAPEEPPRTILAAQLADALVEGSVDQATLRRVFDLCENVLAEGHADAAAMATGFLEALQHADGRGTFDFRPIAQLLGPASRAHCNRMDAFHGAKTRGL